MAQALQLSPRDAFLTQRQAAFQSFARQFVEARTSADRTLEITPGNSRAIALKADSYQAEGDLQRSGELLAQLPAQPGAKINEGSSQMRQLIYQHRYQALISALAPLLKEPDPSLGIKISDYYFLLGTAQKLAGDAAGVRLTWTRARDFLLAAIEKTGGTQGYVHAMLGLMYAGLGEKELALQEGKTALELEGKDAHLVPAAEEILARIEVQLGEKNAAIGRLPPLLTARYHSWTYFGPLTPALLRLDPFWDPLRNDPRFQKLAASPASKR